MSEALLIGMQPNTSTGGVDAVLVNFSGGSMGILHAMHTPYPAAIKRSIEQLHGTDRRSGRDMAVLLDTNLGRFFARMAQNLVLEAGLEMRDITAIGSAGHNIRYASDGGTTETVQLGNPALIARGTATKVVAGFGSADIKAGGKGAPLAPLLHRHLFYRSSENRAIAALGGIAMLTVLPANGGVSGLASGPGNCLMDGWTKRHLHKDSDNNGNWASKGVADAALLQRLLDDDYYRRPAPGSNRLECFTMDWLDKHLSGFSLPPVTVQSTLAELTAVSVANRLQGAARPDRLLVCGAGVQNAFLMRRISAALPDTIVESTTRHGADPAWLDSLLFAWLAQQRLEQKPQDTRQITGARQPILLGEIFASPA